MTNLEHTPESFLDRLSKHTHICRSASCLCDIIFKDYVESHSQVTLRDKGN